MFELRKWSHTFHFFPGVPFGLSLQIEHTGTSCEATETTVRRPKMVTRPGKVQTISIEKGTIYESDLTRQIKILTSINISHSSLFVQAVKNQFRLVGRCRGQCERILGSFLEVLLHQISSSVRKDSKRHTMTSTKSYPPPMSENQQSKEVEQASNDNELNKPYTSRWTGRFKRKQPNKKTGQQTRHALETSDPNPDHKPLGHSCMRMEEPQSSANSSVIDLTHTGSTEKHWRALRSTEEHWRINISIEESDLSKEKHSKAQLERQEKQTVRGEGGRERPIQNRMKELLFKVTQLALQAERIVQTCNPIAADERSTWKQHRGR